MYLDPFLSALIILPGDGVHYPLCLALCIAVFLWAISYGTLLPIIPLPTPLPHHQLRPKYQLCCKRTTEVSTSQLG